MLAYCVLPTASPSNRYNARDSNPVLKYYRGASGVGVYVHSRPGAQYTSGQQMFNRSVYLLGKTRRTKVFVMNYKN